MSHENVIENFATRKINRRTKDVSWSGSRVFSENDYLYSYGRHFILAKYLGEHKDGHIFLKNLDPYSSSTSRHKNMCSSLCYGPSVSFVNLRNLEVNIKEITANNIFYWRKPVYKYAWRCKKTNIYYLDYTRVGKIEDSSLALEFQDEYEMPEHGVFKPNRMQELISHEEGTISVKEIVVLKYKEEYFFSSKNMLKKISKPKSLRKLAA